MLETISRYVEKIFEEVVVEKALFTPSLEEMQPDMYEQIEKELQKQEHLNRLMIKKELEFKEYQKCLEEELRIERANTRKLQKKVDNFNEKLVNKDLELLHLLNEKKILTKDRKVKDIVSMESPFTEKKMPEGLKVLDKGVLSETKPTHHRRRSDDVCKRPSTGSSKKKTSVTKR